MKKIRPVSDLRNKFAEISKDVHEQNEPVFLTKNENLQFESEVYHKLAAAEREAELTDVRYSEEDVLKAVDELLGE